MKSESTISSRRLRDLPSVDALMQRDSVVAQLKRADRPIVLQAVRRIAEELRQAMHQGWEPASREELLAEFDRRLGGAVEAVRRPSLRRVINATGVVIHTNLGRAPLGREAVDALTAIARGYSNLEYDLEKGERGTRDGHCESLLRELLKCEAAVVVNNNAAAVLLVLNTLADGGEVIISRGELVEIGGSFRIPEIMAKSGAILREVGTTNRTRLSDYEVAVTDRTRLILRVHQSNFKIVGFAERPALAELVALGHDRGLPVVEDLGSGCLVDLRELGLAEEPVAPQSIAAGVDLCTFSGDKLLGGPQAGIVAGRQGLIAMIRRNPWLRVVRPDKLCFAALESTLRDYRYHEWARLPVLRMLSTPAKTIRRRAQTLVRKLGKTKAPECSILPGFSTTGGGTAPDSRIPTFLLAIRHCGRSAEDVDRALRSHEPPIIARVQDGQVLIDLRTVEPDGEEAILDCLRSLAQR